MAQNVGIVRTTRHSLLLTLKGSKQPRKVPLMLNNAQFSPKRRVPQTFKLEPRLLGMRSNQQNVTWLGPHRFEPFILAKPTPSPEAARKRRSAKQQGIYRPSVRVRARHILPGDQGRHRDDGVFVYRSDLPAR